MNTAEFIAALFEDTDGHIEIRPLPDLSKSEARQPSSKENPYRRGRRWYPSVAALEEVLPSMLEHCRAQRWAVFYGVLPRLTDGGGKAEDIGPGRVAWVDLDFKDFEDEAAARSRLAGYQHPPSILVSSGHGLHAYWLLSEEEAPAELSKLSEAIAREVGGDRCHNPDRLLRLPGSWNQKNQDAPKEVVVESTSPGRYHLDDLFDSCTTPEPKEVAPVVEVAPVTIPDKMTPMVRDLLQKNKRLNALWEGRGTCRGTDQTRSNFDLNIAWEVCRAGGTAEDAASAIAARCIHDGEAYRPVDMKGARHVMRTAAKAAASVDAWKANRDEKAADDEGTRWLPVDGFTFYRSDPPVYELVTGGRKVTLSAEQLVNRAKLRVRVFEITGRIPRLPPAKRGGGGRYHDWINEIMTAATVVEQPDEVSPAGAIAAVVEDVIATRGIGDTPRDVERGHKLEADGYTWIRLEPLIQELRQTYGFRDLDRARFGHIMRAGGWEPKQRRFGGAVLRLWRRATEGAEATPLELVQ